MSPKELVNPADIARYLAEANSGNGLASQLPDSEFQTIRALVYKQFGIHLSDQKRSLVVARLQQILRKRGLTSFKAYCDYLEKDETGQALDELVNRITTNHTFFFRERAHFDFFSSTALPQLVERLKQSGSRDIRIWCAGCSSGEEPYTLAMLLMEFFGMDFSNWDAGVLATDISGKVLSIAQAGEYSNDRVEGIPPAMRNKYFDKLPSGGWRVKERLRKEVTYRRFNLMNASFPFKKPFHMIFCRNVMIYFDQQSRDQLVSRFHTFTQPGGYLFIGHSESLGRSNCPYDYVMPAVYRKKG